MFATGELFIKRMGMSRRMRMQGRIEKITLIASFPILNAKFETGEPEIIAAQISSNRLFGEIKNFGDKGRPFNRDKEEHPMLLGQVERSRGIGRGG
ncbi:TPA: hypothetical protein EYP26_01090 [Candidatus Bathyarchaeota archaeon]|nr:hypothetical protein [Candidatus Bathyarchaeota archaeon]